MLGRRVGVHILEQWVVVMMDGFKELEVFTIIVDLLSTTLTKLILGHGLGHGLGP